ncbi:MAG: saccharopine dehydrogenase NADP-binding domain-containing protein, partial [Chloroflexota bacterium]
MNNEREFDIIVWGATGFTGRLVAEYLYDQYGHDPSLKWAMAGRNAAKLETVRNEVADDSVPMITADSNDEASLDAMVKRTKVILTTVGPYGKYGSKLVAACVENQTHYCDLSG